MKRLSMFLGVALMSFSLIGLSASGGNASLAPIDDATAETLVGGEWTDVVSNFGCNRQVVGGTGMCSAVGSYQQIPTGSIPNATPSSPQWCTYYLYWTCGQYNASYVAGE